MKRSESRKYDNQEISGEYEFFGYPDFYRLYAHDFHKNVQIELLKAAS